MNYSEWITYLLEAGEDVTTVADMAGHQDIRTTQLYDLSPKKRMQKAASKSTLFGKLSSSG